MQEYIIFSYSVHDIQNSRELNIVNMLRHKIQPLELWGVTVSLKTHCYKYSKRVKPGGKTPPLVLCIAKKVVSFCESVVRLQ